MNFLTILPMAVVMVAGTQLIGAVFLATGRAPVRTSLAYLSGATAAVLAGANPAPLRGQPAALTRPVVPTGDPPTLRGDPVGGTGGNREILGVDPAYGEPMLEIATAMLLYVFGFPCLYGVIRIAVRHGLEDAARLAREEQAPSGRGPLAEQVTPATG